MDVFTRRNVCTTVIINKLFNISCVMMKKRLWRPATAPVKTNWFRI